MAMASLTIVGIDENVNAHMPDPTHQGPQACLIQIKSCLSTDTIYISRIRKLYLGWFSCRKLNYWVQYQYYMHFFWQVRIESSMLLTHEVKAWPWNNIDRVVGRQLLVPFGPEPLIHWSLLHVFLFVCTLLTGATTMAKPFYALCSLHQEPTCQPN